jgi:hypothetical protein
MTSSKYQSQGALRSVARRIAAVISECNYAQRRMIELNRAPARFAGDNDRGAC